ncbi:MAG: imidazole glycerol phosphate synthase subunit HisF [Rhizobiales bacterium]|nr:imidazole glycerol phosphate synthase subunit HisF [Hyphomicrobiales bacterium]
MHARIIPRLDIKGEKLIKGVNLEGLRVLGDPLTFARKYYADGACEILFVDAVASLYGRNGLGEIVGKLARDVFIPLTVTGGIRSAEDVSSALRNGADKVGLNTAAIKRPELISEIAQRFGSQCVVLSVEAKRRGPGAWEVYTDNGREPTGRNVLDWIEQAVALGAGEVLLTSVDREGTRDGYELDLLSAVTSRVMVPVIASGGMGSVADASAAVLGGNAQAVAMADFLHYGRGSVADIRSEFEAVGLKVRSL